MTKRAGIRVLLSVTVGATSVASLRADVGLEWRPGWQTVLIGDTVEVGLYAVSENGPEQSVSIIEAILVWDPAQLTLLDHLDNGPYTWFLSAFPDDSNQDGLNAPFAGIPANDGDGWYNAVSLFPPNAPAAATVDGLLVTTFRFTATSGGITQLEMPATSGQATHTQVWDGKTAGLVVTGSLGPPAVIEVIDGNCQVDADCDDGVACTDDACVANQCVFAANDVHCPDDGMFCNGVERCDAVNDCVATGDPCAPGTFCNEATDACDQCQTSADCDDAVFCNGAEFCVAGICQPGTNPCPLGSFCNETAQACDECQVDGDCSDGLACTDDACVGGTCVSTANDALCPDDGLFCTGVEFCLGLGGDPVSGCAHSGPPCDNCNELSGCTCDPPLVEVMGNRYLRITPQPPGTAIVTAFVVTSCGGTNPQYVGPLTGTTGLSGFDQDGDGVSESTLGVLVDDPANALWLAPDQWGGSVFVTGEFITPKAVLSVQADCGQPGAADLTSPVDVVPSLYGDIDLDGTANLGDVLLIVLGFQNDFTDTTRALVDLAPCTTDQIINIADVFFGVLAFQGVPPFLFTCEQSACAP
ncbi:MAG: hypothetical protein ACE5E5_10800 [Phycisphaerae bacterium]